MIATIIAWLYITLVCFVWGIIFFEYILKKIAPGTLSIDFSITCLLGLSVIGSIALYISLFFPLNWKVHLFFLLPVLLFLLFSKKRNLILKNVAGLKNLNAASLLLLCTTSLMILAISAGKIVHPDTLAYHAQSVSLFETYKMLPGIVNIKLELGFQSFWFASLALFDPFHFNFFSLNSCILIWFVIFVAKKIDRDFKNDPKNYLWVLLLVYTLISWTQVRLSAASASPDFIVSIFIWAAFYIFLKNDEDNDNRSLLLMLASIFACTAVITKVSSIIALALPAFIFSKFLYQRNFKLAGSICIFSLALLFPFFVRSVIATGYPLYPSSLGNFFNVDWKLPLTKLIKFQHYISAYARFPVTNAEAENKLQLPFTNWIVIWWKHLAIADMLLFVFLLIACIANIIFLKIASTKIKGNYLLTFCIALAGCTLWWTQAPDPRFGTGFLILITYLFCLPFADKAQALLQFKRTIFFRKFPLILSATILIYTAYRAIFFLNPSELLFPAGISKVDYQQTNCNAVKIYLVKDSVGCGLTPVPCSGNECKTFIPRGDVITEGFKPSDTEIK